jgi:HSP20 family protein
MNAEVKVRGNKNGSQQKGHTSGGLMPMWSHSLSPFSSDPFQRMRQEFDRLFDRLWPAWSNEGELRQRGWNLDIEEDDNRVAIPAEVPGFEPEDFDIQVRGDQLILRAAHKSESEEDGGAFREWHSQEYYRSIPLPTGVESDHVDATYRNGVLTLTLPKAEESKGRRIEVKS